MTLTEQDVQQLRAAGYQDQEISKALQEIEMDDLQKSYTQTQISSIQDPRHNSQLSRFASKAEENLIRWQLELNDILERAEHILRGDVPSFKDGHVIWDKNPNPDTNVLNEYGVQEIMKILSMYVNRNTILSDYSNYEINLKVYDFGCDLNNLIFMRSEDFGLDTVEKRKNYPILVREVIDIVHSAYKRALDGGERRSLREMISVTQATQTQMPNGMPIMAHGMNQSRERGLLNPMRYIKGKY